MKNLPTSWKINFWDADGKTIRKDLEGHMLPLITTELKPSFDNARKLLIDKMKMKNVNDKPQWERIECSNTEGICINNISVIWKWKIKRIKEKKNVQE